MPGGRGKTDYLPVAILTASGPRGESLDCDLAGELRAVPGPHRIKVRRDDRSFAHGCTRMRASSRASGASEGPRCEDEGLSANFTGPSVRSG